jgi:hypothetical protein
MPFYKSTLNILKKVDEDEVFNENWMDSDKVAIPPTKEWDYQREMTIEDVDIWEVLYEASGGIGVYASHTPYAEFYLITTGCYPLRSAQTYHDKMIETYYGPNSSKQAYRRARELGIDLPVFKTWVDDSDLWLFVEPKKENKIIIAGF